MKGDLSLTTGPGQLYKPVLPSATKSVPMTSSKPSQPAALPAAQTIQGPVPNWPKASPWKAPSGTFLSVRTS